MNEISALIEKEPFSLEQAEKERLLLPAMQEMARYHYQQCPGFKKICDNRGFDVFSDFGLADLPYLPTSIFKDFNLLSVPESKVVKTLYSSSTSGRRSKIMLDKITSDNQIVVLNKILQDFFGKKRRHFIIFDAEETVKSKDNGLSSRGTAIRGMLSMAKKISFVLDNDLKLDIEELRSLILKINKEEKICHFGFTWLIYNIYLQNKENDEVLNLFQKISNQDRILLHIGGWKKLKDMAVSKQEFNEKLLKMLRLEQGRVIDFYGMTEQLGTVYPDCEYGHKHMPLYSDIIIRNIDSLRPLDAGEAGFIQLLSPLPHSYPGISVLSDDIGRVVGVDDCKCGRKGKYFVFEKRSEKAELRGCGDTLNV